MINKVLAVLTTILSAIALFLGKKWIDGQAEKKYQEKIREFEDEAKVKAENFERTITEEDKRINEKYAKEKPENRKLSEIGL